LEAWYFAPVLENGRVASKGFVVPYDEATERVKTGRYVPVDCEFQRDLDTNALPVDPGTDAYIRFGDVPDDETVTRTQGVGPGVPVYEAIVEGTHRDVDAPGRYHPTGPKLLKIILLATKPTYLVTGEVVGTGADAEPLLNNVTVQCELAYDSDAGGFVPAD